MTDLIAAEWIKMRSVRSTYWLIALTVFLSVGMAWVATLQFVAEEMTPEEAIFRTFYGVTLGQLALVSLAVLMVTSEYSTGTIRLSLLASPTRFFAGKYATALLVPVAVAVVTVPLMFVVAQAGLGEYGVRLADPGVPGAFAGALGYVVLIHLLATGLAMLVRGPIPALSILLPLLLLGSQGLANLPAVKPVAQFLPDQAGMVAMHIVGLTGDPRFDRPYSPLGGLAIMAAWAVAALVAGYLVARRRET